MITNHVMLTCWPFWLYRFKWIRPHSHRHKDHFCPWNLPELGKNVYSPSGATTSLWLHIVMVVVWVKLIALSSMFWCSNFFATDFTQPELATSRNYCQPFEKYQSSVVTSSCITSNMGDISDTNTQSMRKPHNSAKLTGNISQCV